MMSDDHTVSENLDVEELEAIADNSLLKQAYNNRWYRHDNPDTYFTLINMGANIEPNDQVWFSYGRRSNSYLLENYGFTLDHTNAYASLRLRVILSTNPKAKIESAKSLFPDQKTLDDREHLDDMTELLKIKHNRVSTGILEYLRSVLMESNFDHEDKKYIMVSTPRVVEFEILVVKFAISMLEEYAKMNLKGSVQKDLDQIEKEEDGRVKTLLLYNIQQRKIYMSAVKLLRVLFKILELIQNQKEPLTSACFKRIEGLEDNDTLQEIFERRMGMRQYFKELKMNVTRVEKMKSKFSDEDISKAKKQMSAKKAKAAATPKKEVAQTPKKEESKKTAAAEQAAPTGKAAKMLQKMGTPAGQKRGDSATAGAKRSGSKAKAAPASKARGNSKAKK